MILFALIKQYNLSNSSEYGYSHYHANSSSGLGQINKENYFKLRTDYNNSDNCDESFQKALALYVLIIYSFNNQIRFNKKGNFNMPVGKRDFNSAMQKKLKCFMEALHCSNIRFENKDFEQIHIPNNAFVYCDPPYTIANATYNQQSLWNKKDDARLLRLLDELDKRNIPFALSNVIEHNSYKNEELIVWSKKYYVHQMNYDYNYSNYHSTAKKHVTKEVLITNY